MTENKSILEMHAKCWDYLISVQRADSSFYFVPRKINKFNRLEQGYFFIGNDEYMLISFWDGVDTHEKIHNISWGVGDNGLAFIEMSAKDDAEKVTCLAGLVSILEQRTGAVYKRQKKSKWRYEYPKSVFYLDSLQSFISKEKPIIDEYIRKKPESGISMLDKEFNEKFVLKQLNKKVKTAIQKDAKKKLEGIVSVSPSSYMMALRHNELQNELVCYLKADGQNMSVSTEDNNVDITVVTVKGEKIFYELKTSDVKQAIRLAIGQLLEYCHYPDKTKADKLVIVTKYVLNNDDIAYLKSLRTLYHMPA